MNLEIIDKASDQQVLKLADKGAATRPEARCTFDDKDCDSYFRVLNRSLTRAGQANTIVGVDKFIIVDTTDVDGENILALLSEYGTQEGPLYNSQLIYGDSKSAGESMRKKDWRLNSSQTDINNLQLLQAMTLMAKRQLRCFDIYMQNARFRRNGEDDKYGIVNGWQGNGTGSNLSHLNVELQGCVDQSRFDRNQSRKKRSHCPLGCFNVRVHDVDLRPRVPDVIRREQETVFEGAEYWDRLDVWLRFFITSRTHFDNDPDTESGFWKRYRTALYSKRHQHYTDYTTYRENIRGQQRVLLRKRENTFLQVTPGNADKRLKQLQESVVNAYLVFVHELKYVCQANPQAIPEFEITWYIVSSISMVYYTMLRLLTTYSENPRSPCHKVRFAGPQPSHAAIQMDMFFNAPLLLALRNYLAVNQLGFNRTGNLQTDGIESVDLYVGHYSFKHRIPTKMPAEAFQRSVVKNVEYLKIVKDTFVFVSQEKIVKDTREGNETSLVKVITDFMGAHQYPAGQAMKDSSDQAMMMSDDE